MPVADASALINPGIEAESLKLAIVCWLFLCSQFAASTKYLLRLMMPALFCETVSRD